MFHFTCFNVEDPHDPSVGLIDGQLTIPGNLLRREVFDPVIGEVCNTSNHIRILYKHDGCDFRSSSSSKTKYINLIKELMLFCSWEVLLAANI
jgi:hypothetical protein